MALPTSGPLTLAQIQTEFGGSNPISLNEYYAGGANVPAGTSGTNGPVPSSGQIAISNFYGTAKSTRVTLSYTFSSPTADASLNLSSIGGYSAGQSDITVTVNSGVYLYATSTGSYGLNLSGGTTGDTLVLVNNGYIMGQGGNGGSDYPPPTTASTPGGPALNLGFGMASCTINNTNGSAYIGGGGGGGGWGWGGGGGGAGGGRGGNSSISTSGGAGGGIGSSGGQGSSISQGTQGGSGGGGGGRIFPGSGGSAGPSGASYAIGGGGGGAGGAGGGWSQSKSGAPGGNGGSANNAGGSLGSFSSRGGGGGGGWGASGGTGRTSNGSGGGGKAVNTNGKAITWTSGDTSRIYGAVA